MVLADQVRDAVTGFTGVPRVSVATRTACTWEPNPRAGTSPRWALTTDWSREFGLPADIIKGGICISGMYDLTPVPSVGAQ